MLNSSAEVTFWRALTGDARIFVMFAHSESCVCLPCPQISSSLIFQSRSFQILGQPPAGSPQPTSLCMPLSLHLRGAWFQAVPRVPKFVSLKWALHSCGLQIREFSQRQIGRHPAPTDVRVLTAPRAGTPLFPKRSEQLGARLRVRPRRVFLLHRHSGMSQRGAVLLQLSPLWWCLPV